MSWYSRTWAACSVRSCEAEVLKNRAVVAGWVERSEGGWLCPIHKPYGGMPDSARAAAGDKDEP